MSNESKGDAYKEMGIEPWDVIISNFNASAVRGYFIGETLAYLMRYNGDGSDRGGVKDLKKAQAFIERLIEYDENCSSSGPVRMGSSVKTVSFAEPEMKCEPYNKNEPINTERYRYKTEEKYAPF